MKKGRAHVVPLSSTVVEILQRRRAEVSADESRVFPGLAEGSDDYRALSTIRTGYDWIDLRRTMTTRMAEMGISTETRARVLAHAKYSVQARHYDKHEYLDEKRDALERWDAELQRIIRHESKTTAKIKRFAKRRA